jgi:hypothetical protein
MNWDADFAGLPPVATPERASPLRAVSEGRK